MFSNIPIDIEQLPQYQLNHYQPLADNAPIATAVGWVIFFIFLYLLTAGGYLINLPLILNYTVQVYLFEIALTGFSIYWSFYSHRYKGYALREHDILYKTGVLWRKKTILPFNRIQHIETNRSLLQRKLNIASIRLYTAGGLKADLVISGMDSNTTDEIKQLLLSKIQLEVNVNRKEGANE